MAEDEMRYAAYPREQSYRIHRPKWTIMIYLAGDNNLSANSIAIMQELEAANEREDVRVLACFDSNTPRPRGARYLEINYRRHLVDTGMDWGLHNDLVPPEERKDGSIVSPDFCNPDPASVLLPDEPVASEGLSRFLKWALRYHRAERHMLILFGHGTAVAGNTFLADDSPPSFLRLPDFARILERHFGGRHKLDVLACDNCVMSGIEFAYQIRRQVDFMIASQGLMLASGWPFRKIINAIERNPSASPKRISRKLLKVCARDLLDFSLMDRSSEQSLCDLRKFNESDDYEGQDIIWAVKRLAVTLMKGLEINKATGEVVYPFIRDIVRLARLEAQSYWDETFVDLYDFCKLLVDNCNTFTLKQTYLLSEVQNNLWQTSKFAAPEASDHSGERVFPDLRLNEGLLSTPLGELLKEIVARCNAVMKKVREFVPYFYYVGAELQYSNGLSIYFPWTLPEDPIIFEPTDSQRNNFRLKTAFEEYENYKFAKASRWATFLRSFFRATLRNVRRFDNIYRTWDKDKDTDEEKLLITVTDIISERPAPPVNLNKSSSDIGRETDSICPTIKNYPRRFYVSPADCLLREGPTSVGGGAGTNTPESHVSYLGWNVRGLVAEAIGLPPLPDDNSASTAMTEPDDNADDDSDENDDE